VGYFTVIYTIYKWLRVQLLSKWRGKCCVLTTWRCRCKFRYLKTQNWHDCGCCGLGLGLQLYTYNYFTWFILIHILGKVDWKMFFLDCSFTPIYSLWKWWTQFDEHILFKWVWERIPIHLEMDLNACWNGNVSSFRACRKPNDDNLGGGFKYF